MARILVIDDDNVTRLMLWRILEKEGYEVFEASNGEKGIQINRTQPADLIITDIIMPEKEGIETIRELKEEFPDVKIIAISAGGRGAPEIYLKMATGFGAADTIKKPINREELLEKVKKLIS